MFDPYLQWFKIPANLRPPTHYELLGVSREEASDPVMVRDAAERRSDQLLRYTSGPNAADCVRLAEEVEKARNTLLDQALRRRYDASLRRPKQGPGGAAKAGSAKGAPAGKDGAKAKPKWLLPVIAATAVVLVLTGGAVAYFLNQPAGTPQPQEQVVAKQHLVPLEMPPPVPPTAKAADPDGKAAAKSRQATLVAASRPMVGPVFPPAEPPPDSKLDKLPVPDSAAQERAERDIKAAYRWDYARARNAEERLALAAKFLQPGRENRKDPAAWFVLLREARELAVKAERPRLAVEAISEIDKRFTVDPLEMALDALTTISHPAPGAVTAMLNENRVKTFVSVAAGQANQALKADRYDIALQFIDLARERLTKTRPDKKVLALLESKRADVEKYRDDFKAVEDAREKLKASPDDPAASVVAGTHLACASGKWDEGLKLLAKGSDAALKEVALAEISLPGEPRAQLAIAGFWWRFARAQGGRGEAEILRHAADWYERALERLPEGEDKELAIERFYEIKQMPLAGGVRLSPGSFFGRDPENHILLLREGGGTMQSEEAVERGLRWIAAHQALNGSWGTDSFYLAARCSCPDPGKKHDIAGTAFGLLPLLASGSTHKQGRYKVAVAAGITYLMQKQGDSGGWAGGYNAAAYENALATIALSEAYGMTKDPFLEGPATRAVNYIVQCQSPFGGWGYEPKSLAPDTSVTFWSTWAVQTALHAGVFVPKETFQPLEKYLDRVAERNGPGYWYKEPSPLLNETGPRPSLLPDGILCREFLGATPESKGLVQSVRALARPLTLSVRDRPGIYYLFFAQQALHHFGGREWEAWNPKARDILVELQDRGEEFGREHRGGSWSPVGHQWMEEGGRLMSTSLATLTLQVYYSRVPLNGFGSAVLND
jgi:hypothetical protein